MILELTIINGLIFISYGSLSIFTDHMRVEFIRYELSQYRLLVGWLEILGGIGVILGFFYSPVLFLFSTFGLTTLMLLGIIVRLKVRDSIYLILPAFMLFILNIFLSISQL